MAEMKLIVELDENGSYSEKYVPLSKAEIAQREADAIAWAEAEAVRKADEDAKATAKAALIARAVEAGFSDAEIAVLTGIPEPAAPLD
jgi:DNA-directed RNA polymerase specialized sigma24 family protein